MPEPRVIPMFPLGTVLFPHALLPVRVFEPPGPVSVRATVYVPATL